MTMTAKACAAVAAALLVLTGCGNGAERSVGSSTTRAAQDQPRPTGADWSMPPTTALVTTTVATTTTTVASPEAAYLDALNLVTAVSAAQQQQLIDVGHGMCDSANGLLDVLLDIDPNPTAEARAAWVGKGLKEATDQSARDQAGRYGGYDAAHEVFARVTVAAGRTLCPQHEAAVLEAFPGM